MEAGMDELQRHIDALLKDRERLVDTIKRIDNAVASLRGTKAKVADTPPRRSKMSVSKTVETLMIKILRRTAKPLHYSEIMDRLQSEENYEIKAKNPKGTITAHLSNSDKIIRFGRGIYGLAEWKKEETQNGINQDKNQIIDYGAIDKELGLNQKGKEDNKPRLFDLEKEF
jgi:hypothetical protein